MENLIGRGFPETFVNTEESLLSSTITELAKIQSQNILVLGTITINSFGNARMGAVKKLRFSGVLVLTYNATSLILPALANITTAANDCIEVMSLGSGNWIVTKYTRASGLPLVGTITSGTVIATTSGTTHDFTGIPATARKIILALSNISTSASSAFLIQIGDSGGIENTGYVSEAVHVSGVATVVVSDSSGFVVNLVLLGTDFSSGNVILSLVDPATNTWSASGNIGRTANAVGVSLSAGDKSLSATLDRVRLTTVSGIDTFDSGKFQILYQ